VSRRQRPRLIVALWGLAALLISAQSLAGKPPHADVQAEAQLRQQLIAVALARQPADLVIENVTLLNVFTSEWQREQDIVIAGARIAWTGPHGGWPGKSKARTDASGLWAVPGFGESHKHIESSYLTPEYEAALVIPTGNTWTVEGSHEMSNVVGPHNIDFWLAAEDAGSPLKIFPAVGSATPPTAYEQGGGYYGYDEMSGFLQQDLRVVALGEVMDWPAVSQPKAPANERIWGMISATWAGRGVVEGHGSGLQDVDTINAFAAAGLSSDHEVRLAEEGLEKVRRGVFLEVRADAARVLFPRLAELGITDLANVSVTTDDRDVAATRTLGAMDYNIRNAIESGAPVIQAYQMGSYNTARHFRIDHLVGALAPGRYADVVLLDDPKAVSITSVYVNGKRATKARQDGTLAYTVAVPKVAYPAWARNTIQLPRQLTGTDFEIAAPAGRDTVTAAVLEPFYFKPDFMQAEMGVQNGVVTHDPEAGLTKVAVVDRYRNPGAVSKMIWKNVGPLSPRSALASSQMHDIHNIWVVGNDDTAMALAANTVANQQGGWALVHDGQVVATVVLDIAGLMTARPVDQVAAEVERLFQAADKMAWINNTGLPERMRFAFLTASPWRWQLVAPSKGNPAGLVNVTNGETHPVIW
jgi:adenine deaminase